jgi:hypothetical protein
MALPQNVLSTTLEAAALLPPRQLRTDHQHLTDQEEGGVALQDGSGGLQVQVWTCVCDGHVFQISSPGHPTPQTVLTVAGNVVDMSFTFDSNMRVFIAYMLDDFTSYYYWYDSTIPGYTTSTLPSGSLYARCTLDDKRAAEQSTADIIIAYTRSSQLYYRQQRDRFGIVYHLTPQNLNDSRLINIGISRVNRLQFNLTPQGDPP